MRTGRRTQGPRSPGTGPNLSPNRKRISRQARRAFDVQGRNPPPVPNAPFAGRRLRLRSIRHRPDRRAGSRHPGVLDGLVLSRRGNLAWDDADYLRRGLANARFAEAGGPLLASAASDRPAAPGTAQAPWFVAWIEVGVHAIGRRNIDLLIVFSTVVPYALLMAAVTVAGRWLRGPWGGFLSLVCLAASPLSLAFGGKVMVETFLALWVLLVYCLIAALRLPRRGRSRSRWAWSSLWPSYQADDGRFSFPGPIVYGLASVARSRDELAACLQKALP